MTRVPRELLPLVIAGTLALVLGVATSIRADIEQGSAATPALYASIQALERSGPGGAEASASWDLSTTTVARPTVGAGSAQYTSLCAMSSGGAQFQPGTRVGWAVEGRLLSTDTDGARVAVRWTRKVLDPSLVGVEDLVREYETRLHEGTRMVIDFLRPPAGDSEDCDGVVVKMWLEFRDPPELAGEVLDYDVWLVHYDAAGREVLERSRGRTLHGESLDYLFPRLRYTADGRLSADGAITADYAGSVRGRIRPDGRIDLALYAHRTVLDRSLGQGDSGQTQATVADGETLDFQMPPAVNRPGGFEAQRTSIRVTVRRVS